MSYPLRELQIAIWAPFLPWLHATASFLAPTDGAPCVTPANQFAAGCDLLARLCQRYPKPAFGLTDIVVGGTPVAVTEAVVLDKPFCRLLHFERATACKQPVALIVWRTTIYPQLRELIYQQDSREAAQRRTECLEGVAA